MVKILTDLSAQHELQAAVDALRKEASRQVAIGRR